MALIIIHSVLVYIRLSWEYMKSPFDALCLRTLYSTWFKKFWTFSVLKYAGKDIQRVQASNTDRLYVHVWSNYRNCELTRPSTSQGGTSSLGECNNYFTIEDFVRILMIMNTSSRKFYNLYRWGCVLIELVFLLNMKF